MVNKLNLALKEKFVLNYWCLIGLGDSSFLWGEELGGGGGGGEPWDFKGSFCSI